jgi:phosphoribosylformylglycinamidine synthase
VKVRVLVMPKTGVLDPQGRAVQRALRDLGYQAAVDARTGRVIELELATTDAAEAHALAAEMCDKLLANPVIEDYSVEIP